MFVGFGRAISRWTFLAAVAACLLLPTPASAALITPDTSNDDYDTVADTDCSLREAVQSFNTSGNFGGCIHTGDFGTGDTIELNAGIYKLTRTPTTSDNSTGDLDPSQGLIVEAAPGAAVTIDGNNTDRIFFTPNLTIHGLTLTNGNASDPSPMAGKNGGAIFTGGGSSLTITDSTIAGNSTDGLGGGIAANGPVSLTNVTVSGNTTTDSGGGGIAIGTGSLSLESSTVAGNMSLVNSAAQTDVTGGILVEDASPATATAHNSIIAGNTDASDTYDHPNCQGTITSTGGNVIDDTTGCTFTSMPSDSLNAPALLGALADNGGTTFTHALMTGSPAIDRAIGISPAIDQRGFARPSPSGGACDSGAYELGATLDAGAALGCPVPVVTPPATGSQPQTPAAQPNPLCASLRAKLKRAKKSGNQAKVRKLRRKLRRLGC